MSVIIKNVEKEIKKQSASLRDLEDGTFISLSRKGYNSELFIVNNYLDVFAFSVNGQHIININSVKDDHIEGWDKYKIHSDVEITLINYS